MYTSLGYRGPLACSRHHLNVPPCALSFTLASAETACLEVRVVGKPCICIWYIGEACWLCLFFRRGLTGCIPCFSAQLRRGLNGAQAAS